ncbi:hypothetical protein PG984_000152 [Apiospora sp. TS-2023a]
MDYTQLPNSMSSFPTQDQEDWSIYYEYMDAAAQSLGYDPAVFGGSPGAAPDYTGYVVGFPDPPINFENQAPGPLSPNHTLRHSCFTVPVQFCGTDNVSLVSASPSLPNAIRHDEAGSTAFQDCRMAPTRSEIVLDSQIEDHVTVEGEPAQTLQLSSSSTSHCGLHGCQMTFNWYAELREHQQFHAKHHWVANQNPFVCECGQACARLDTLQRHIQKFQVDTAGFRCQECETLRSFKRKDHLVQHLRHRHKYSDAELQAHFPIYRAASKHTKPVCPFPACPDHRGEDFWAQNWSVREHNMPFAKKSDYTKHMRDVHDWSPHPCTIPSCDKRGKHGYFRLKALQQHQEEQHLESEMLMLEP